MKNIFKISINYFVIINIIFSFVFPLNTFAKTDTQSEIVNPEEINFLLSKDDDLNQKNIDEEISSMPNYESWLKNVQNQIQNEEYNTYFLEDVDKYLFNNRKQNLKSYIDSNFWTLKDRDENLDWFWTYNLDNLNREGNNYIYFNKNKKRNIEAENNLLSVDKNILTEWYKNTEQGIEQGFTIKEKISGEGLLKLEAIIDTNLKLKSESETKIVFSGKNKEIEFSHLEVFDANNNTLDAYFEYNKKDNNLIIVVDDSKAVYPIIIDPLASSASWTAEGGQVNAYLGWDISSAGDVNGDGYSDIIISAWYYDVGELADAGKVWLYYGSSSGLSETADWTAEGDQALGSFGSAVSSAGDVNGDGYSDIIIGADYYTNGESHEGKVFVYYGSSSGLSETADWTAESNQAGAEFGYSVSSAGDVNGDGYSDVIIGSFSYDNGESNEGAAFVYYGSSVGLSETADWSAESNQVSASFGYSVSSAGDVNGDGYGDVIISSYMYDNGELNEGAAFVYYGSSSGLSETADWTAESNQADAKFANKVSSAGDVNGDGYSDVIVGSFVYDNGELNEGAAFVYYGSSSGLSETADWTVEGNQVNAYFGRSVSSAGDVNGDGYSDVIVGADYYDNGETDEGKVFVYYGSSTGLSETADWTAESNQVSARFGRSVSSAGDVNGDGYDDIIVGADYYTNGESREGSVFLYYGGANDLSTTADWTAESNQANAYFGYSVSSAGDVNGDGYSDVLVGAWFYDNGEINEGKIFLYNGSSTGLSETADWTAESNQASAYFGRSVSSAGDVNGDGYDDIIVSAWRYDNGETDEGKVFVYYGSSTGLSETADWTFESDQISANLYMVSSVGDVNGDGFSDIIIDAHGYDIGGLTDAGKVWVFYGSSTGLSETADWTAEGDQTNGWFGNGISSAGDVNGDGYSDIIVGAWRYDNGETDEGKVFVYYGSSTGLSETADWTAESNQASAYFGRSVSSAGDVNGDGYSDIIVGAYKYDNDQIDEGKVFVYYGSSTGLSETADWTAESNQVNSDYGLAVSSVGDVNGDGYGDIIVGADYYDNGETNEGKVFVYYGNQGGISKNYKQLNSESEIIANLGESDSNSSFKISAKAKAFNGRSNAKLQYEVKPYGSAFTGTGLVESSTWTDTGVSGVTLTETVTGLYGGLQYHWRARFLYDDGLIKYFTPWFSASQNSWTEASLRTYPYILTYTAGANGTLTGTTTQLINYDEDGTAITAVPNATYHFVNWSDGSTQNPRTDTNITSTISVTANFAINDGGGTFMPVLAPVRIKNGTEKLTNSDIEIKDCKIDFSNLENIKNIAISKTVDFENSKWDEVSGATYNLLGDYIGKYYIKFNSIDGVSTDILEIDLNCGSGDNNQDNNLESKITLFKYPNSSKVYLLEDGKKRWIKSELAFNQKGYNWDNIEIIDEENEYLDGEDITENQEKNICSLKYFNYNFSVGDTGSDVKDLQVFLNNNNFILTNNGYGALGNETEYYGILTQNAFNRYKENCANKETENKAEVIQKETNNTCQINNYLYIGSTGDEVKCLQEKLKDLGYFTYPYITSYFGPVTVESVVNFQKANNLTPYPGWVGPGTRAALNSL